jgi:hypothetical protein
VRRVLIAVVALCVIAAFAATGQAATSSSYKFVGGPPITYTSNNQVMVIWRYNKAAPRGGSNNALHTAANVSGVGYTGTKSGDSSAGYGASTLNKSKYCYQQIIQMTGALKNAKVGAAHTVTTYVNSNTVAAKSTLQKGDTTNASLAQSKAKSLGC